MRTYESLVNALSDLKDRGYTFNFKKEFSSLFCEELKLNIEPEKFNVDEYYRLEADSNPDDTSIVYAISSIHGVKGVLIDAYGVYAENVSFDMARRLNVQPNHTGDLEPFTAEVNVDTSSALKSILVPFDFSQVANYALSLAIDMAIKTGIHLHILHVLEFPVVQNNAFVSVQSFEDSYKQEIKKDRSDRISLAIRNITNKPIHVSVRISFGSIVDEIIDHAETSGADLIIAGSHGVSGIREFVLGSNAEKIVRKSTTPVLIVKEYHHQEVRSIVVATELGANQPGLLIEMARKLQSLFGAVLHIVIIESSSSDPSKKTRHQQWHEIQDRFGVENVTWNFIQSSSIEESIIEFAELIDADMICISAHKRHVFSLRNGSITKHLVNHSSRMILSTASS